MKYVTSYKPNGSRAQNLNGRVIIIDCEKIKPDPKLKLLPIKLPQHVGTKLKDWISYCPTLVGLDSQRRAPMQD